MSPLEHFHGSARTSQLPPPGFKANMVLDVLTGSSTQAEVCRKHQISPTLFGLGNATLRDRLAIVQGAGRDVADVRISSGDGHAPAGR